MSNNIKTLTLILSSNTYPSLRNMKMQKKLLLNQNMNFANNIYWYRSGNEAILQNKKYKVVKNDLYLDADDSSLGMGEKTLLAFEWALENFDFDFLMRTNTSSYINYQNLNRYIKDNYLDQEYVYSGAIHETNDVDNNTVKFASGSAFLLNRKTVNLIVENKDYWDHQYWDDVSLAILLSNQNISPVEGLRFDITGNITKQSVDTSYYHYRCRSDNHYGYPRFLEIYILKILHQLSSGNRLNFLRKNFYNIYFEFCKLFYIHQFGWKVFTMIRKILQNVLPVFVYKKIKNTLKNKIDKFKLVRFKI